MFNNSCTDVNVLPLTSLVLEVYSFSAKYKTSLASPRVILTLGHLFLFQEQAETLPIVLRPLVSFLFVGLEQTT